MILTASSQMILPWNWDGFSYLLFYNALFLFSTLISSPENVRGKAFLQFVTL